MDPPPGGWVPPRIDIAPHPIITRNLTLTRYTLSGEINGSSATTRVSLDFRNDTGATLEGDFVFPVPPGAVVSDFALRDGDKRLNPELLEANHAREWYLDIVRRAIDPGLLEYVDQRAYRVRAFPFAAGQTRTIELSFSHQLPQRGTLRSYTIPLQFAMPNTVLIRNLQEANLRHAPAPDYWVPPTPQFVVSLEVEDASGLGSLSSTTHKVAINRRGSTGARVSAEGPLAAASEFTLLIGRANDEFNATVLTYPGEGGEDGYFVATIYPSAPRDATPIPKDLVLVLDTSGSMEGEKWTQAQGALEYVVRHLDPHDRLALIDYDDLVNQAWSGYRAANDGAKNEAVRYIQALTADGGTNINDALERAAAQIREGNDPARPDYLLFFTDGLPTVGETDPGRIISNVAAALPDSARLFTFGVGYDVNTLLLDQLSRDHHGASDYVEPAQNIESVVSAFYNKIQRPALTDIRLDWGGLEVHSLQPARLPDLFHGTELLVAGRYRGKAPATVTLTVSGNAGGKPRTVKLSSPGTADRANHFIPRVWANMRIGRLMEQLRTGPSNHELIREIELLARRYGIVTPYTSYLVREDMNLDRLRSGAELQDRALTMPGAESGAGAVQQSKSINARQAAPGLSYGASKEEMLEEDAAAYEEYPDLPAGIAGIGTEGSFDFPMQANGLSEVPIANVGNLTFMRQGAGMVDSRYDPTTEVQVVQVAAFSDRYFALLGARPELGEVFAQASEVTVMVAPNLALQTVLLDDQRQPVPASQVNRLREIPTSRSPQGFNEASDADWRSLMQALATDFFQG
ncbi:MAG TPA: VIT and VWA domain-containing protein [bacterium]|nr:VIT and VWA domain-containing protein [bacterium]